MPHLRIQKLNKSYGAVSVLKDIDLDVERGEFVVFVGPSGCGKSTLLRMICGLDELSSGTLEIDGEVVNDVPAAKRGIAMVFQSYALYPHMSVAQNMGYALKLAKEPRDLIASRVANAAEILKLSELLDRKPRQLSGGQRQRVAIGRAIVREPQIFLFDEPLSNLDAALRVDMRMEFARLKARLGTTMIYVTHDQVEAMTLADKIVVMHAGRIEQVGSPLDLYYNPANRFIAGFIGSPRMNFLPVQSWTGSTMNLPGGKIGALERKDAIHEIGIRPEHAHFIKDDAEQGLAGTVLTTENLGSDTFTFIDLPSFERPFLVRSEGAKPLQRGAPVRVTFDASDAHLFAADGSALTKVRSTERAFA